jgi:hypothetical protein
MFNTPHGPQRTIANVLVILVLAALLAARSDQPSELSGQRLVIVAPDGRPAAQLTVDEGGTARLTALTAEGGHAASIALDGKSIALQLGTGEGQRSLALDARAFDLLSAMLASDAAPVTPENLAVTVAALKQTSHSLEKEQLRLADQLTELHRLVTMTGDDGRQGTLLRELSDMQRDQQREVLRVSQRLAEMDQALDRLDRDVRDVQRRVR